MLPKSYCLVAQGTTVVDLLCVEPGPIVCLIGRIRRPTQGTGRGSSCGALVGIPISSVIRRDSEWPTEGNVSVTYVTLVPWRRERRRHVPSPQSLYTAELPGLRLGSSAKAWINAVHLLPLILTRWSAAAGCNDRMPMSIGSFSYTRSGLVSLARSQFRRSSDVTSPFPPSGNEGYIRNRDVFLCFSFKLLLFQKLKGTLWMSRSLTRTLFRGHLKTVSVSTAMEVLQ